MNSLHGHVILLVLFCSSVCLQGTLAFLNGKAILRTQSIEDVRLFPVCAPRNLGIRQSNQWRLFPGAGTSVLLPQQLRCRLNNHLGSYNNGETTGEDIFSGRKQRRTKKTQKPRSYWENLDNVERELTMFWRDLGVYDGEKENNIPAIPNETLLNHFLRHDLRAAIVAHGGRENLSQLLDAEIIPGKWREAVRESPEVQKLLQNATLGLSAEGPPPSPQQLKQRQKIDDQRIQVIASTKPHHAREDAANNHGSTQDNHPLLIQSTPVVVKRWSHKPDRKEKGFWSTSQVIKELHEYLDEYQEKYGRPAVWMPRLSELSSEGRDDLKLAIGRYGGISRIVKTAGLVPFREWKYFEGQYQLFFLLKQYLDEYHSGDHLVFPTVSQMKTGKKDYHSLHDLIQYYGGRKFLSGRLGMVYSTNYRKGTVHDEYGTHYDGELHWGRFSLEFALRLFTLIRNEHKEKRPPLQRNVIAIPHPHRLQYLGEEGLYLHKKIQEYGGYENVARRLGLAFVE